MRVCWGLRGLLGVEGACADACADRAEARAQVHAEAADAFGRVFPCSSVFIAGGKLYNGGDMAEVRPELKAALKEEGRWAEFQRVREERIRAGSSRVDAIAEAVAAVCPEHSDLLARRPGRPPVRRAAVAAAEADALERVVKARRKGERIAEAAEARRAEAAEARSKAGLVSRDVFSGKGAVGAADEVLWVAKNLFVDVSAEDAPGELAWNLLSLCRESAEFRVKFMLNIASDVVKRRSDEEAGGSESFDGEEEFRLLEGFRAKMREIGADGDGGGGGPG